MPEPASCWLPEPALRWLPELAGDCCCLSPCCTGYLSPRPAGHQSPCCTGCLSPCCAACQCPRRAGCPSPRCAGCQSPPTHVAASARAALVTQLRGLRRPALRCVGSGRLAALPPWLRRPALSCSALWLLRLVGLLAAVLGVVRCLRSGDALPEPASCWLPEPELRWLPEPAGDCCCLNPCCTGYAAAWTASPRTQKPCSWFDERRFARLETQPSLGRCVAA